MQQDESPVRKEIPVFAESAKICMNIHRKAPLYWNQSEGTPHKKTKQDEPRSKNAEIYESLIGRVIL